MHGAFMLRRSMPWSNGQRSGPVFVAFGRSFDAFEVQLQRMIGAEDGITDALFSFTRPITGAYFQVIVSNQTMGYFSKASGLTLEYEVYEELALSEMAAIAAEAERAFGARVAVEHRTGTVAVGDPSVIVAASAGHRPAAFAACRFVIDELKARVPIWKRTVYADGGVAWIDGSAPGHPTTARSQHA